MSFDRETVAHEVVRTLKDAEGGTFWHRIRAEGRKGYTAYIKERLGNLGTKLGYQIGSHTFPGANSGEWLYDMIWLSNYGANCGLERIYLVLESEFAPGGSVERSTSVDPDFSKLVQARADIRVWCALVPNDDLLKQHRSNCIGQIDRFIGTLRGDEYFFALGDWTRKTVSVERYVAEGWTL